MAASPHIDLPPKDPHSPILGSPRSPRPPDLRRPVRKYYTRLQSKLCRLRKTPHPGNMVLVLLHSPAEPPPPPLQSSLLAPSSNSPFDFATSGDHNNKSRILGGIEKRISMKVFRAKPTGGGSALPVDFSEPPAPKPVSCDVRSAQSKFCGGNYDDDASHPIEATTTTACGWLSTSSASTEKDYSVDKNSINPGGIRDAGSGSCTSDEQKLNSRSCGSRWASDYPKHWQASGEHPRVVTISENHGAKSEDTAEESAEMAAAMAALDLDEVECECCGMVEEYTRGYVERTRRNMGGHWLCGLCETAVHDELARSRRVLDVDGLRAALEAHMLPCRQFRRRRRPSSTFSSATADVPEALCRLLRRHLSSPAPRRRSSSFTRSASSLN